MHPKASKNTAKLAQRIEMRWLLPVDSYLSIHRDLSKIMDQIYYSDKSWSRTLYFNNDSHDIPWGMNIKARKYFSKPIKKNFYLNERELWIHETKLTPAGNTIFKTKTCETLPLKKIIRTYRHCDVLCDVSSQLCPINSPLRPFLATEYERIHFIGDTLTGGTMRLTLDRNIRYWHQLPDTIWVPLGREFGIRIEIKCNAGALASSLCQKIEHLIVRHRGIPVISKRFAALNRLNYWQKSLSPQPVNEFPSLELETSFSIPEERAQSFSSHLYQIFKRSTHGFVLDPQRPYLTEWSMIRLYLTQGARINLFGDTFRLVIKKHSRVKTLLDEIKCSREEKSEHTPVDHRTLRRIYQGHRLTGAVTRHKRQFWVCDNKFRLYKISVHRSSRLSNHSALTFLDIEYEGASSFEHVTFSQKKILTQLTLLRKIIEKKFPYLSTEKRSLRKFSTFDALQCNNPMIQTLRWLR